MTLEPNAQPGEPVAVRNGLAICAAGAGEPLLLMPYPHGFGLPFADWPLANLFQQLGRRVVTFDPPGAGLAQQIQHRQSQVPQESWAAGSSCANR